VQGINRFGRVAGTFVETSPRKLVGLISQYAATTTLGVTQIPFAAHTRIGDASTNARGINDLGVTTGFMTASNGTLAAFAGCETLGYEVIVPPGGDGPNAWSICSGINNFGQLACAVSDADGNTQGLFIGTPVLGR